MFWLLASFSLAFSWLRSAHGKKSLLRRDGEDSLSSEETGNDNKTTKKLRKSLGRGLGIHCTQGMNTKSLKKFFRFKYIF